jgi:hypothetical protein
VTFTVVAANFTAAGFILCGEHNTINAGGTTHNVTYNSALGGLQEYNDAAGC